MASHAIAKNIKPLGTQYSALGAAHFIQLRLGKEPVFVMAALLTHVALASVVKAS